jgi:hypothetical protein
MHWHEVKYQPEQTKTFLGSPSIVRLPDGVLLVSHDYFGLPNGPKNHEGEESLTSIYRSEDNGATWVNVTHIMNCYWSSLFLHDGAVYILGTSQQYGSIMIRRSDDGGFTWTHPADPKSGLLFKGGFYHDPPSYHCAPVPVVIHNGRIYKAFEDCDPLEWGVGFQACVISAPANADLLDANNWTMSNKIPFNPDWIPMEWNKDNAKTPGWREGNVVVAPDGQLWNIMTFEAGSIYDEKSPRLQILDDGKTLTFDPETGYIDFPGSKAKFTIRRDPETGTYLSLVNNLTSVDILQEMASGNLGSQRYRGKHPFRQRNILSLIASDNLWNWRIVTTLMRDETGLTNDTSILLTGFQYVDWQFDGDDLIYVVRTGYRGARNFHDSNRIIFRILKNFRDLL